MSSVWEILKDTIWFFRLKDVEDIDVGRTDFSALREKYRIPSSVSDEAFRWVKPDQLHAKTAGTDGLRVVKVMAGFQKRARLIQRRYSGEVDLILCVKQAEWPN